MRVHGPKGSRKRNAEDISVTSLDAAVGVLEKLQNEPAQLALLEAEKKTLSTVVMYLASEEFFYAALKHYSCSIDEELPLAVRLRMLFRHLADRYPACDEIVTACEGLIHWLDRVYAGVQDEFNAIAISYFMPGERDQETCWIRSPEVVSARWELTRYLERLNHGLLLCA